MSRCRTSTGPGTYVAALCVVATLGLAAPGRAEEPARGFFGLTPVVTNEHVEVRSVSPGGPAERAGVRPGDVILTLAGGPVPTESQGDVFRAFTAFEEGETVEIVLRRNGSVRRFEVTLGSVPVPTREDQKRIDEVERKVRAAEVVEEIFRANDEIELALADGEGLRLRGSGETAWTVLDPEVAKTFEPIAARFLRPGKRSTVKLEVDRNEDGSLALVPVD